MTVLLIIIPIGSAFSLDDSCLDPSKKELLGVESKKKRVMDDLQKYEKDMKDNEYEIASLKREQRESPNIVRGYKLQQQLQKSNDLNSQLQNLKNRISIIEYNIGKKKDNLIACYDKIILKLEDDLKKKRTKKSDDFVELIKKYKALTAERDKIRSEKGLALDFNYESIHISSLDGRDEIEEKKDILLDWKEKIAKESKSTKERLKELEERKSLFAQVKQFIDETYFFSEEFKIDKSKTTTTKTEDKTTKPTPDSSKEGSGNTEGGTDGSKDGESSSKEGEDDKEGGETGSDSTTGDASGEGESGTGSETDESASQETGTPTTDETPATDENTTIATDESKDVDPNTLSTEGNSVVDTTTETDAGVTADTGTDSTDVAEKETSSMKDIPFKGDLDIKRLDYIGERSIDDLIKSIKSKYEKLNSELKKLDDKIRNFDNIAKQRE